MKVSCGACLSDSRSDLTLASCLASTLPDRAVHIQGVASTCGIGAAPSGGHVGQWRTAAPNGEALPASADRVVTLNSKGAGEVADVEVDMNREQLASRVAELETQLVLMSAELDDLRTRADAARALWNGTCSTS